MTRMYEPSVAVETHDDTFYTAALFRAGTF